MYHSTATQVHIVTLTIKNNSLLLFFVFLRNITVDEGICQMDVRMAAKSTRAELEIESEEEGQSERLY